MLSSLLVALLAAGPVKRPYTIQDQVALKRISAFKASPDGSKVVFQLRTTDVEANRGRMDLWLVGIDGKNLTQLTSHPDADTDPVWCPDGSCIYFLSARSGTSQVWKLSFSGGEPSQVTNSPIDIDSFNLSKDGALIAFSAETYPDCDTLDCTKKRLDEKAKEKTTGKLYDGLFFRHWDTWKDGRRSHIFISKIGSNTAPVDVMKKMKADAPSKPFGGAEEYTFTADAKQVIFTARDVGASEAWSTDQDLFSAPIDGSKAPTKLTTTNRATDTQPVIAPDGKTLAWLAMSRPGFEADKLRVMVKTLPDGKERSLTDAWDRSADSISWSPDSKTIVVTATDLGQHRMFAIDVADAKVRQLDIDGNVIAAHVVGTQLLYLRDSLAGPADLYTLPLDGKGAAARVTDVNKDAMAALKLGAFEQFSFAGWNGETVYAYLVKPIDFDPKKKYPVAFLVHGGPQGSFGNDWHYRWNPQVYAAHGYAAIMVDFHGSTGYGQAFTDSISTDWGGKPLDDLKAGLAAALAKYPFLDKNKLCALGASYGGFMINYMAGVWNEPWKCLVSHDGNLDERMAYFDTEELWFPEWEHKGTPWAEGSDYTKFNPIDHVAKWKVPMLVVHGGKDYRVVDTQGMSTFTALQRRGIPSQFLYFPDENHWVLKPANSVLWHTTVLKWLDQWTK